MEEFKPNSKKYYEENTTEEKKVEKVIKGEVRVQKASPFKKFKKRFMEEDAKNIKEAAVKIALDGLHDILNYVVDGIFGTTRRGGGPSGRRYSTNSKVSYISYNNMQQGNVSRSPIVQNRQTYNLDDYIFESRSDAEDILQVMSDLIEQYHFASISDLKGAMGVDANDSRNYTERNWGWFTLKDARTERINGGGYVLRLPKPVPRER